MSKKNHTNEDGITLSSDGFGLSLGVAVFVFLAARFCFDSWIATLLCCSFAVALTVSLGSRVHNSKISAGMRECLANARSPVKGLKLFRFFLPKKHRVEIDLIIADVEEDIASMRAEGRSSLAIWAVQAWHAIVTITGYLWSGIKSAFWKVVPLAIAIKHIRGK